MTLDEALRILARVHTEADDTVGFVVDSCASPEMECVTGCTYLEAWGVVREHLGLQVEPTK